MYIIGIDLGGKKKKTTAVCVLQIADLSGFRRGSTPIEGCENKLRMVINKVITGSHLWQTIQPYLSKTKVIAVDAPLTRGRGKGQMRLWEKFFSTKFFRKYHFNPFPPAIIPQLMEIGISLARKLRQQGFRLNRDFIEVFPTFSYRVCKEAKLRKLMKSPQVWETSHQKTAYFCAWQAFLHYQKETFWIGYRDGLLFLPDMKYWKKIWQKRFIKNWLGRDHLKYRLLRVSSKILL